jgi:hypothetical protein
MANIQHKDQTFTEGIHQLHNFIYNNVTNLNLATGTTSSDVGKIAAVGTGTPYNFYILADFPTKTWYQLTNQSSTGSSSVGSLNIGDFDGNPIYTGINNLYFNQNIYNTGTSIWVDEWKYALIADQKATGTNGGTFTNAAWRTRDLNTELSDIHNIVSISSNQFILNNGNYIINIRVPAYGVARHRARLRNITNSVNVLNSIQGYTSPTNATTDYSFIQGYLAITGTTTYEVQHYCETTVANFGYGVAGVGSLVEIYTTVEILKIK